MYLLHKARLAVEEWQDMVSDTLCIGYVYKLIIGGYVYIGQTKRPLNLELIKHFCNPTKTLQFALKRKEIDEIGVEVLHKFKEKNMLDLMVRLSDTEISEIHRHDSVKNGLNYKRGTQVDIDKEARKYESYANPCLHCGRSLNKYDMVVHLYSAHKEGTNPFVCKPCELAFEGAVDLFDHNVQQHFSAHDRGCPISKCRYKQLCKSGVTYHLMIQHGFPAVLSRWNSGVIKSITNGFECKSCEFWTLSEMAFIYHGAKHPVPDTVESKQQITETPRKYKPPSKRHRTN